ncbi:MAG: TatD family hydrolase [Candidatus Babeliales bacterium]
MLIDTHAHLNIMVKKKFDVPLTPSEIADASNILKECAQEGVTQFINVGTSLIESQNCVELAKKYDEIYAVVGIHPNDCTKEWLRDFKEIEKLVKDKESNRIVGIGECGLDRHYPDTDLPRQIDAFNAHIELALEHNLPIVVHTRDALDETALVLEKFKHENLKGIIHCFSGDQAFAQFSVDLGFVLGIGGPLTYPKNSILREIFATLPLEKIVLETDAPYLPIQEMRGKPNHPKYIKAIAQYLAELRDISFNQVAKTTTQTAQNLFNLENFQ